MKRDPGKIGRQISFELAQPENEASKKDLTRTPPKVVEFPPAAVDTPQARFRKRILADLIQSRIVK
jgi:hypothetical protein